MGKVGLGIEGQGWKRSKGSGRAGEGYVANWLGGGWQVVGRRKIKKGDYMAYWVRGGKGRRRGGRGTETKGRK